MKHLGDYALGTVVYDKFSTYQPSTGKTFALSGATVSVAKDASTNLTSVGATITGSFGSIAGLNHWSVDTSSDGTFYAAGSAFQVYLSAGTVDGVTMSGAVLGSFTLLKASALRPTVAGRALDVSAGGEAGVDWANVGSPTTTVGLSGTTVKAVTDAVALPASANIAITGNITGNLSGSVGSVTGAVGSVTGAVGSVTGSVGGNVTGSVGSVANITVSGGIVSADIKKVNNVTVAGDGAGTPWGP